MEAIREVIAAVDWPLVIAASLFAMAAGFIVGYLITKR
jgi:hypothetical protein